MEFHIAFEFRFPLPTIQPVAKAAEEFSHMLFLCL
jgi:hypothetical protein